MNPQAIVAELAGLYETKTKAEKSLSEINERISKLLAVLAGGAPPPSHVVASEATILHPEPVIPPEAEVVPKKEVTSVSSVKTPRRWTREKMVDGEKKVVTYTLPEEAAEVQLTDSQRAEAEEEKALMLAATARLSEAQAQIDALHSKSDARHSTMMEHGGVDVDIPAVQ